MKTRIISGIIMVPLLLVLYFGGIVLWAAALIIAFMGIREFCGGWNNLDVHPSLPICCVMSSCAEQLKQVQANRDALFLQVDELSDRLAYAQTDEYVMRVARDELGMILPGEVRYVNGGR